MALFVSFEASLDDLVHNFASLGFDLATLARDERLAVVHVTLACAELVGPLALERLFIRLGAQLPTLDEGLGVSA